MTRIKGVGPAKVDIMIVGDCASIDDELQGAPFSGAAGHLLTTMLREAGIDRRACFVTNVVNERPPSNKIESWITDKKKTGKLNEWEIKDGYFYSEAVAEGLIQLQRDVEERQPRIIIGLGNAALWAFTGEWGVTNWRGSEMGVEVSGKRVAFVPTLHPASILRSWATRAFVAHDLKARIARRLRSGFVEPTWDFNYAPTLDETLAFIAGLAGDVAVDVETSRGQIVCVGLGVSATRAMCIPFISEGYGSYWSAFDCSVVLAALKAKLLAPSITIVGQNFNYDASYFDENFQFVPRVAFDTLIAQTTLFPGTPRGLGHLASMYCDWHCYWKDDARDWSNLRDFDRLFKYNCRDVCATWEVAQHQRRHIAANNLVAQFAERMTYNHSVFDMMQEGVIRNEAVTVELENEIEEAIQARKIIIADAAGHPINPTSPVQVSKLLYSEWNLRKPARKGKDAGGTGDEELKQIAVWHPERAEVLTAILEHRSLASMRSNFLRSKLDPDGRLRSGFMATGTETFRLTSSKNNFGRGTNLLNVSGSGTTHSGNKVPNFRTAITPPEGYTIFDCDVERADLLIVVWEADDADLKAKMRAGLDIHTENAKDLFGTGEPTKVQREKGKTFVHLTDYGGCARTAAIQTGSTIHETDMAQRRWFAAHPGIKEWHNRTQQAIITSRTIRNKYGYRMVFFDRTDGLLPQALAWQPQSTVAIVASLVHMRMEQIPGVTVWIQCYDSVVGIYPTADEARILPLLHEATKVVVPYDDPLVIPMGCSRSTKSWGDCKYDERGWT